MGNHENLRLKESGAIPTSEMLEEVLGGSYAAYEMLQDALPGIEIEQDWQWYTPHKAWFARGRHFYETTRGTRKEKTLYWLHVYDGYFSVAIWFKEKNRAEVLRACVGEKTKQLICDAKTWGKVPTFPVVFDISTADPLADVYELIDRKKKLEG